MKKFLGNKYIFPAFIVLTVICFYNILLSQNPVFGDDVSLFEREENQSVLDFVIYRYMNWSSRLWVEALCTTFCLNTTLFYILNTGVAICSFICLCYLLDIKNVREGIVVALFFLLYPYYDLFSAGYISTSVNYLWGLFAVTSLFSLLKFYESNKQLSVLGWCALTITALMCAFLEQTAIVAIVLLVLLSFYLYYAKRKFSVLYFVLIILMIVGLLVILVAPGNANRTNIEMSMRAPTFSELTVLDKIMLGSYRMNQILLSSGVYASTMFSAILFLYGVLSSNKKKIVMFFSLQFLITLGYMLSRHFPALNNFFVTPVDTFNVSYTTWIFMSPILLLYVYLASVCITLILCFNKGHKSIFLLGILFAGFVSQLILGFSPTVYASVNRTAIYLFFALLSVSAYLFFNLIDKTFRFKKYILAFLILLLLFMAVRIFKDTYSLIVG